MQHLLPILMASMQMWKDMLTRVMMLGVLLLLALLASFTMTELVVTRCFAIFDICFF